MKLINYLMAKNHIVLPNVGKHTAITEITKTSFMFLQVPTDLSNDKNQYVIVLGDDRLYQQ